MGVVAGDGQNLRRIHRRQRLLVGGIGNGTHTADTGDGGSLRRNRRRIGRQHNHFDLGTSNAGGAADALGRALVELTVQVFGDDEDAGHGIPQGVGSWPLWPGSGLFRVKRET